ANDNDAQGYALAA
ncbi:tmRNA tag peptide, partial [Brucella sp. BO2]